jgi:cytochrome b561
MNTYSNTRYGALTQSLHWVTAILVLVAFVLGPGGSENWVYSAAQDSDRQIHETLGVLVFALTLLRLVWLRIDTPPQPVPMSAAMHKVSKAVQGVLYLLLLGVPVSAVLGAFLEGHALTLLGGVQIAPPVGEFHRLGARLARLHGWLGDLILWVAGAHAAAAIYHHALLKDAVLRSMLPRWLSPEK